MIEETSAGAVVFRDDSVRKARTFLVLHYPAGHWDFPKGAVEKGETEEQAARRSLKRLVYASKVFSPILGNR